MKKQNTEARQKKSRGVSVKFEGMLILLALLYLFIIGMFLIGDIVQAARQMGEGRIAQADDLMKNAETAMDGGRFTEAIRLYDEARRMYEKTDRKDALIDALAGSAEAYQAMGSHAEAVPPLKKALEVAHLRDDPGKTAMILGALGQARYFLGDFSLAKEYLSQGLRTAEQTGRTRLAGVLHNTMGNVLMAEGFYNEAVRAYEKSAGLSKSAGETAAAARAYVNAAKAGNELQDFNMAYGHLTQAMDGMDGLPDNHDKAYNLIAAGETLIDMAPYHAHMRRGENEIMRFAFDVLKRAERIAETINDATAASYAHGYLGRLYEARDRRSEALQFTRKAVFEAQSEFTLESLYLWQWQTGRLLKAGGDAEGALSAYRQAVTSIEGVREDLSADCIRRANLSFRKSVGPIYFELADLLLQKSATIDAPEEKEAYLLEARSTIEKLKTVELQDYFQDDCVTALQSKITRLDQLLENTAAVYPILLPDRTEILLTLPDGVKQYTADAGARRVTNQVRRFRARLQQPDSRFRRYAGNLYDWLIRPYEDELASRNIDTLIFVPDGPLRTIPMSALYDGENFLVSKYAIVTTPGLTLTDPHPLKKKDLQLLLNGLTESVQGFNPLPNVAYELEKVKETYDSQVLQDGEFTLANVQSLLKNNPYPVVHIASHGQFDKNPRNTFLLTYDGKLTMDMLENLMGLSQYREEPVELLTLSACQTALGDDRAALGLAGVALKAGARSAIATLWFINDQATSRLVTNFYAHLKSGELTKAQALQQAQLDLMAEPGFEHPAFWAPFLLIGNWL